MPMPLPQEHQAFRLCREPSLTSQTLNKSPNSFFDGGNLRFVSQRSVDVAAQVGRQLCAGFANNQDVIFALAAGEKAGFKDNIVARRRLVLVRPLRQLIIAGKEEYSGAAASGSFPNLLQDTAAGSEVRSPNQVRTAADHL